MSSHNFESLEDDFTSVLDAIKLKIDREIPDAIGEERKRTLRLAERELEEANLMLHDMESEAKQAPVSYRTQMLGKVRNYRRSLDDASKTLGRQQLTGGGPSATNYGFDREDHMTTAQRSKLMQGTQSLNRTSESIARSQKVASETDQIGVDIIDELGTQRDSLLRTRERLTDTDSNLVKSRKILRNMARRVITDKIILCIIVIVELATLAGLVYWKFFSK